MKRTIFTYGILSGAVIIGSMILSTAGGVTEENMVGLVWLGYLVMIVSFSMIFFGVKQYRDQAQGGVIKFSTATKVGLGITLVASVIYVFAWEVSLAATDYAFVDDYWTATLEARQEAGTPAEEMEAFRIEMEEQRARYLNPVFRLPITFFEIFPVGLLISLITAAILRKSEVLPAAG